MNDPRRIAELAHEAGALAWADAVHYAPHGPIDVAAWGLDVLICSPYKFFGPHQGLAYGRRDLLESWRPYKVRPAPFEPVGHRFDTGTMQHELLAGFVAAVEHIESLGWDAIRAHERGLGERFLGGLPANVTLYGPPTMEGRVPTFAFNVSGRSPAEVSAVLGERGFARVARQLLRGRDHGAAGPARRRRAGRVRPLQHVRGGRPAARGARGAVRLLLLGGTKFLGKHVAAAALASGHEVTLFTRGETNPDLFPEAEHLRGDRDGDLGALEGREWDAVVDTSGYVPRVVGASAQLLARRGRALRLRLLDLGLRGLRGAAHGELAARDARRADRGVPGPGLRRAQGALRGGGRARASGTGARSCGPG